MKHFTLLASLILLCCFAFGQQQKTNNKGEYLGVVRIKFKQEQTSKVDVLSKMLKTASKLKTAQVHLSTNFRSLNVVNKTNKVSTMTRVFPYAGKNEAKHKSFGLHLWYEIRFDKSQNISQVLSSYKNIGEVELSEPILEKEIIDNGKAIVSPKAPNDHVGSVLPFAPNDPLFKDQWHYNNTGQFGGSKGCDIDLLKAWKIETGNKNVIVAIEDGGVDWRHEDLTGNMWQNPGEIPANGIDDDNNGYIDDVYGYNFAEKKGEISIGDHGTHVAGTVAAETNNGVGLCGVAGGTGNNDGVRIMSCNVFAKYLNGGFAEAYVYAADNGATISQNSWGYTSKGHYQQSTLDAIDYFIENAGGDDKAMKGGIVIFAAGNDSDDGQWWPGCYDKVLSVAATNNKDVKSWFSNYDSWVDIAAPGGEYKSNDNTEIHSTLPNNNYGVMQGTSMACPHVSGVAALVLSKYYGRLSPKELADKLTGSADNIDELQDYKHKKKIGSGRLNAFNALNESKAPLAPVDIKLSNLISNSFSFEWSYVSAADRYVLEIRKSDSEWETVDTEKKAYTYINAIPATNYQYRIKSYNNIGSSAYTEIVSFRTNNTPPIPATPANITVNTRTYNSIGLLWNEVKYSNRYVIEISSNNNKWQTYTSKENMFTVNNLSSATEYSYRVKSVNESGASKYSEIYKVTTKREPFVYCISESKTSKYEWISMFKFADYTKYSNSTKYSDFTSETIQAEGGQTYHLEMQISRPDKYQYATRYAVYIDYNKNGKFDTDQENVLNTISEKSGKLSTDITIPYNAVGETRLRLIMKSGEKITSACGTGFFGETEDYTINIAPSTIKKPIVPIGLRVSNITLTSFRLHWKSDTNTKSYKIQIKEDGKYWKSFYQKSTILSYNKANIETDYQVRVQGVNIAGNSDFSKEIAFKTLPAPIPGTPTGIIISKLGNDYFHVEWNKVKYADEYILELRKKGEQWASISTQNTKYSFNMLSNSTNYEFRMSSKNNSGLSKHSSIKNITTLEKSLPYCQAESKVCKYEWISKVVVEDFVNNSEAENYNDFSSQEIRLQSGKNNHLELTPAFYGNKNDMYWRVWIDYDKDAMFSDIDELVFDSETMSKEMMQANIFVDSEKFGKYRMRIIMKSGSAPESCGVFDYGEVEDYTVNIKSEYEIAPMTPMNIFIDELTSNSVKINWTPVALASSYELQFRKQNSQWITYYSKEGFKTISDLDFKSTYEYRVMSTNESGNSEYSETFAFSTKSKELNYCESHGTNNDYEWLFAIIIGNNSIVNRQANTYYDRTEDKQVKLKAGGIYKMTLIPGYRVSDLYESWKIWIDYNKDGVFSDSEVAYKTNMSQVGRVIEQISISDKASGICRVRVSMKHGYEPSACEIFNGGSVVDFTANFTPLETLAPKMPINITNSKIGIDYVKISWDNLNESYTNEIKLRERGKQWVSYNTNASEYTFNSLKPNTIYEYSVCSILDNVKSEFSHTQTVKTLKAEVKYCEARSENYNYEWIKEVAISSFNNTSGASEYTFFGNKEIIVNEGETYSMNLSTGYSAGIYKEYWTVYIDYNKDNVFDQYTELAYVSDKAYANNVEASISIPRNTKGITRMRVIMNFKKEHSPCEIFANGEVEDYIINIQAEKNKKPNIPVYVSSSNVKYNSFDIKWNEVYNAKYYKVIIKQEGKQWEEYNTSFNNYTYSKATANSIYRVAIMAVNQWGFSNYSEDIIVYTPDIDRLDTPTNINTTEITSRSISLNWDKVDNADRYAIAISKDGEMWTELISNKNEYSFDNLEIDTKYFIKIKAENESLESDYSTIKEYTTLSGISSYCTSKSGSDMYEWIEYIKVGSIENASSNSGGYSDFTNMSTNLSRDNMHRIFFKGASGSQEGTQFWNIWIDFDRNGEFSDQEHVLSGSSRRTDKFMIDFFVPEDAKLGKTRMRVSLKYDGNATACGIFEYGEVEDYTINIVDASENNFAIAEQSIQSEMAETLNSDDAITSIEISPNPTKGIINIVLNKIDTKQIDIYNAVGQFVLSVPVNSNILTIDISDKNKGIYFIKYQNKGKTFVKKIIKQ